MRFSLITAALLVSLPALAEGMDRHFYLEGHWFSPTLEGHYQGVSGGNPIDVDLKGDLGLAKDKTKIGYGAEYQGPRFGLELSTDEEDYAGAARVQRDITINGQKFQASTLVTSSIKATNTNFNWTIRVLSFPEFWVGLDLGARALKTEISAHGQEGFTGVTADANYTVTLPIPQIGASLGFNALDDELVVRGFYHLLSYKGATYTHTGVDLRYFPISWLGLRGFLDAEHFKVPKGSIKDDLDISLDRVGSGFGVVLRF